jgi:disintegrin and metalloproteinase domain-containing protein 10
MGGEGWKLHLEPAVKFNFSKMPTNIVYGDEDVVLPEKLSDYIEVNNSALYYKSYDSYYPKVLNIYRRNLISSSRNLTCNVHLFVEAALLQRFGHNLYDLSREMFLIFKEINQIFQMITPKFSVQLKISNLTVLDYNSPYLAESENATIILNSFSRKDQSSYCLSHLILSRKLSENSLGLAYLATPQNIAGICGKRRNSVSYNVGLSSFNGDKNPLPNKLFTLVLAHELGHNFGALHDFETSSCKIPSEEIYIMYPRVNSGKNPDNFRFSSFSIKSIMEVLKERAYCLQSYSSCGNGVLDGTEECDCGFNCEKDQCCTEQCTLKKGAQCSPHNHVCCTPSCQISKNKSIKCRTASECRKDAYCDGKKAVCPKSEFKSTSNTCGNDAYMCQPSRLNPGETECTRDVKNNVCLKYHLEGSNCLKNSLGEKNYHPDCVVCCKHRLNGNELITSAVGLARYNSSFKPHFYPSDKTCADNTGFCDGKGGCRIIGDVDVIGTIEGLLGVLPPEVDKALMFIQKNWYYFLLGWLLILLIFVGIHSWERKCNKELETEIKG